MSRGRSRKTDEKIANVFKRVVLDGLTGEREVRWEAFFVSPNRSATSNPTFPGSRRRGRRSNRGTWGLNEGKSEAGWLARKRGGEEKKGNLPKASAGRSKATVLGGSRRSYGAFVEGRKSPISYTFWGLLETKKSIVLSGGAKKKNQGEIFSALSGGD